MTRIRPPSSCRPVVNVLESLSLRIGYAKRMLVAVTVLLSGKLELPLHLLQNQQPVHREDKASRDWT